MRANPGKSTPRRIATLISGIFILMVFSNTAWSDAIIPPVAPDHPFFAGGEDRRPHIPLILEQMSPLVKDVAAGLSRQLPPDSPPQKCAEVLNLIATELHNTYLLSMATRAVPVEAEETYARVKKLKEQIKELCK